MSTPSLSSLKPIETHKFPKKTTHTFALPPELSSEILPFLTPKDTNTLKKTLSAGRVRLIPKLYEPLEKALKNCLDTYPANNHSISSFFILPGIPLCYLKCAKLLATSKILPGLDNLSNSFLISVAKGERGNTDNQIYAIAALSEVGYKDAIPMLKDLLSQTDLPSNASLQDKLSHRDLPLTVREQARVGLVQLESSEKVILEILSFFNKKDPFRLPSSINPADLAQLPRSKEAHPVILSKEDQLRPSCIPILSELSIKTLKIIIEDPSFTPHIKEEILTKLPSDSLSLGSPSEYQEFLLSVVKNPMQDMSLREKALQGIHQLPPLLSVIQSPDLPDLLKKQAISWIDSLMHQRFSPNREVGQALLQMLIELREERPEISGLNHKNYLKCLETYRCLLIQALGSLRYEEAESHLRELFNNDSLNPYEQKIIIDSLGKIGSHQSIPFLVELFKKSPPFSSLRFGFFNCSADSILYPAVFQALDNIDIALFDPSLLSEYEELLKLKLLPQPQTQPLIFLLPSSDENQIKKYKDQALDKLTVLDPSNALQYLLLKLKRQEYGKHSDSTLETYKAISKLNTQEAMEKLQEIFWSNGASLNEKKLLIIALRDVASETSIQTLESIFNSIEGYSLFTLKQFALEALCKLKDMSPLLQDLATADPAEYAFAYTAFTSCPTGADHLRSMIQNPGLSPTIKQSALKVLTSPSTSHTSWEYPQKALQNLLDLVTDASLEKNVKLQVLRGISSFLSSLKEVKLDQELYLKLQQTLPYFIQELNSLIEGDTIRFNDVILCGTSIRFDSGIIDTSTKTLTKEACLETICNLLEHPSCRSFAEKTMGISFFTGKRKREDL